MKINTNFAPKISAQNCVAQKFGLLNDNLMVSFCWRMAPDKGTSLYFMTNAFQPFSKTRLRSGKMKHTAAFIFVELLQYYHETSLGYAHLFKGCEKRQQPALYCELLWNSFCGLSSLSVLVYTPLCCESQYNTFWGLSAFWVELAKLTLGFVRSK